jgi:hypothetical protein
VAKSEGRRPLGRPRRRWLDNIKTYLVEMGWSDVDLVWLRIGTGGEFGIEPSGSIKCWETIECPNS